MTLTRGQVLVGRRGHRFAVESNDPKGGVVLRSLAHGVTLNGTYDEARIEALIEAGTLRATDEVVDLEALDDEAAIPGRMARLKAERAREDAAIAGQRLVEVQAPKR